MAFGSRDADHAAAEGSRPLAPTIHAIDCRPSANEVPSGQPATPLAHLERTAGPAGFWVHLDDDVVDFFELPVADIPLHNAGLTFDEAMRCLTVFARREGLAASPSPSPIPTTAPRTAPPPTRSVRGLVGALAG